MRFIPLFSLLIYAITSDSCQNPVSKRDQILRIDGSSTVFTLSEAIAEEFIKLNPEDRLTIGISGTGGGFRKFARGEISIANASRKIKEIEATACRENGIKYLEIPVAYDGLAIITNSHNGWLKDIKLVELKKIWEPDAQNRIHYWDQIRADYPHQMIKLYGPGTASGTFDYFTEVIVGQSGASRGDFMPSEDDHVLIQGVAGDLASLGFVGLAYYEENIDRVKLVPVDNGSGPVTPSRETILSGRYNPLTRKIYMYVSSQIAQMDQGVEFVHFFLDNAGKFAQDVGFIPLADSEYRQQLSRFSEFLNQN
ncbi:MAG: PstS family phosphate ABC transporter substrate-binding protein [Saprospiraceae bacterium]|nr:PstS family phosphate ABC transporter substrate-binding protein [Saprospiraceae bacterium]